MSSNRQAILDSTDYEPYDNRTRPDQTSFGEALVHLIKGIVGTGILALPDAFKNAGMLLGTIGCVVFTIILTWCLHLLFGAMYFFCKRDKIPQINYPDAFKEGLKMGPNCLRKCANSAPFLVNFFILFYQLGTICVYGIFCATNIKQVVDQHSKADAGEALSVETYMILFLPFFMLVCYIKNLKWLAPFSTVANWLTLLGLMCIYYFFFDPPGVMADRHMIASMKTIPLFIGTTMFAALSIGPTFSIEMNLKDGRQWPKILNIAMVVVTLLNIFTGVCGYWKYGEDTQGVITLNIDINHPLAQGIRILFSMSIYISYALQAYPITEIFWEQYVEKYMTTTSRPLVWNYVLRTIIVLLAFLLAVSIPYIDLFISLVGAFCVSMLALVFPALLDICIRWPDDFGAGKIVLIRDIIFIILGFIGWGLGTNIALIGIFKQIQKKASA